ILPIVSSCYGPLDWFDGPKPEGQPMPPPIVPATQTPAQMSYQTKQDPAIPFFEWVKQCRSHSVSGIDQALLPFGNRLG
ncbi:MAG: hypothetical protein OXJ55_19300, partial [Caldilineaceae bacterium]|nr:hypothetical protein [Caldilineaceae bacterium]